MKEIKGQLCVVTEPRDYLDRLAFSGPGGQKGYVTSACITANARSLYTNSLLLLHEKKINFADAMILLSQLCDYSAVDDAGDRNAYLENSTQRLLLSYRQMQANAQREKAAEAYDVDFGQGSFNTNANAFIQDLSKYKYGFTLPEEHMLSALATFADKKSNGISIPKIVEKGAFRKSIYDITEHTLEPTLKSEKLISLVEEILEKSTDKKNILELGVGSGALLISLLKADNTRVGYGVDISPDALQVARQNIKSYDLKDKIHLFQGSWFEPVPKDLKFDVIYSNPPYLDPAEIKALPFDKKNEPYVAYNGGPQGLDPYKLILSQAKDFLNPNGHILFEINNRQAESVSSLMKENGFSAEIVTDYRDKPRVVIGKIVPATLD